MNLPKTRLLENRKGSTLAAAGLHVTLLLGLLCVLAIPAWARTSQQGQSREKFGSLTSVGEVYVNDLPIPVMATVSSGDRIRTGESAEATLVVAGKGTLKIRPVSEVVLSGNDPYSAELEIGTILLNSVSGSDGLMVRIGNYVVVPSVREIATAARVTRTQDGSFLVSCTDGKIGVLTVGGKSGQLLQAGQSLTVSAKPELSASSQAPRSKGHSHTRWFLLGLAGAGAAGAAAALTHHGGSQPTQTTVTLP